ncbi:Protein let-653 [Frankliniella fusca]|uniref:Protein let-653 n=1 Tax=Frankliniella fusca TaxID=407009 RepID=A0AAE1L709_9NEOP|nr:Protein let-653 [Frankliniella fusca]
MFRLSDTENLSFDILEEGETIGKHRCQDICHEFKTPPLDVFKNKSIFNRDFVIAGAYQPRRQSPKFHMPLRTQHSTSFSSFNDRELTVCSSVFQIWSHCWHVLVLYLSHTILMSSLVQGQCFGGTETYEKTTGVKFLFGASQGILTQPGTGITRDCTAICRQTPTCAGFTVDYETSRCQSYSADSSGHRSSLHDALGSNYFEKICLRGVSNLNAMCGDRLWAFERVVGAFLDGFDDREEHNVQTKTECEKLCLFETAFTCRSAEFDEAHNICRLSREDRRSQPSAFRRQPGSAVDYLENQCVRSLPDCRYNVRPGFSVVSMDELQFAASQSECEALCDQARGFTCRAFTYAADEKRCYLSGDDSISLSNAPLAIKRGAVYAEKQCSISQCDDGLFTFEKVTGHFLRSAQQVGLAMASSPGVTLECGARCLEAGSDCPAFSLDYAAMKCFKLDRNTQGRGSELSPREGQTYFEKICLRGNVRGCVGRAWAFERRPGKELRGLDDVKLPLVQTRRDCLEACLAERRFDCRSAEYDSQTAECRLSSEDRRTRPSEYVDAPAHVEYLENQCLPPEPRCTFESVANSYPRYLDLVLPLVADERDCERRCYSYTDFICRSYSYYPSGSQCFISGDDRSSAGPEALMSRPGTNYLERNCHHTGPGGLQIPGVHGGPVPGFGPLLPGRPLPGPGPGDPSGTIFSRAGQPELVGVASGRCPGGGRPEFEKVAGYELAAGRAYNLERDTAPGVAVQCAQLCRSDPRCGAFNLDYARSECTALEGAPSSTRQRVDLRPVPGVAYFEAICLRGGGCGLAWTYERHINFELRGYDRVMIPGLTKTECEDRCADERTFLCRSATYNYRRQECRLSTEDRHTQPHAFVPSSEADYLENQCASLAAPLERCVYRNQQRDRQLVYTDKALSTFSDSSCQHACDVEREFLCRSYTFLSTTGLSSHQCLLSGSLGSSMDSTAYQAQSGALYAERECSGPPVLNPTGPGGGLIGPTFGPTFGPTVVPSIGPSLGPSSSPIPPTAGAFYPRPGGYPSFPLLPGRHAGGAVAVTPYPTGVYPAGTPGPYAGAYPPGAFPSPSPYPPAPDRNFQGAFPTGTSTGGGFGTGFGTGTGFSTGPGGPAGPGGSPSPFSPKPGAPDPILNPYPCRGTLSYEKVAGATYTPARRDAIRTRADIGISGECLVECAQQRERCLAVSLENVRGGRQRCYSLDRSSDAEAAPLAAAPDLAYFQKICLQERPCPKAWVFNRVPSYELVGTNSIEVRNIFSRRQCQDECLRATRVVCRSATYYARDQLCKLSPETRRTQPHTFRRATPDVDYMENECAPQPPNCEYSDSPGRFLPYTDRYVARTFDVNECKRLCDQEREFQCRSFNFHAVRRDCFLSSDDTFAADRAALMLDRDFYYSERGSCSNVRVDCTQSDMLITFLFGAPFEGRVYATGNPQACFEMGSGQAQLVLRIPMGTQCGTVQQGRGRYVNHVVIQQNPVIMQETDKTVRVECSFDASDQTVSYAPSGTRDQEGGGISVTVPFRPSGANIVTNTAPTPNVRMRIVTRAGQEAAVVGLGEELQLRVEIDPTSAFGIFARNLEARTDNGELLTLIDNVGCPRDPIIFPALQVERGSRDLFADFKAFRFPSTATVNFVATVQFCQDICEPIRCYNGVHSFGKRRRRSANDSALIEDSTEAEVAPLALTQVNETSTTASPFHSSSTPSTTTTSSTPATPPQTSTMVYTTAVTATNTTAEPNATPSSPPAPSTASTVSTTSPRTSTTAFSSSSSTTTTTTTTAKPEADLPGELPLQLRLVVGEDSLPKPAAPKKNAISGAGSAPILGDGGRPASVIQQTSDVSASPVESADCTPQSSLIAATTSLMLLNAALCVGFAFFYRVRKRQWSKSNDHGTQFAPVQVGVPEVLFRNVYDRLPPNPTFSTLSSSQLSST